MDICICSVFNDFCSKIFKEWEDFYHIGESLSSILMQVFGKGLLRAG